MKASKIPSIEEGTHRGYKYHIECKGGRVIITLSQKGMFVNSENFGGWQPARAYIDDAKRSIAAQIKMAKSRESGTDPWAERLDLDAVDAAEAETVPLAPRKNIIDWFTEK